MFLERDETDALIMYLTFAFSKLRQNRHLAKVPLTTSNIMPNFYLHNWVTDDDRELELDPDKVDEEDTGSILSHVMHLFNRRAHPSFDPCRSMYLMHLARAAQIYYNFNADITASHGDIPPNHHFMNVGFVAMMVRSIMLGSVNDDSRVLYVEGGVHRYPKLSSLKSRLDADEFDEIVVPLIRYFCDFLDRHDQLADEVAILDLDMNHFEGEVISKIREEGVFSYEGHWDWSQHEAMVSQHTQEH